MAKWVYTFGDGKAEGKADMKNLLGGKGANLAEMANLGLPVPPGFTITTEVCTYYYANERRYPDDLAAQVFAGAIASALRAEKLVLLTDVEGVKDAKGKLISELSVSKATKLIDEGVIQGGMIPKVSCCIRALASGVRSAHIIDGRQTHAVLLEIFTDKGVGTILHE